MGSIPMSDREQHNRLTFVTKRNHNARELLRGMAGLEEVLPAIEQQNERHDGSGAPEGLRGDAIVPLARILGLALELDRLLSNGGPDGKELSIKEAFLKTKEMADKQFDRQTVNALLIAYRNGKLFNQEEEFFEVPAG
jgi:HD-GYP domain-containing protein (c-di-GMP phosphodiesterase class II)